MSSGFEIYAISETYVRSLENCGNQAIFDEELAPPGQSFAAELSAGNPDDPRGAEKALHHVMFGEEKTEPADNYARALMLVCRRAGRFLNNRAFMPLKAGGWEWSTAELRAAGLTSFDIEDLLRGSVWDIPRSPDLMVGSLAGPQLTQLRSELATAEPTAESDPWTTDALANVRSWMDAVSDDTILISVYV